MKFILIALVLVGIAQAVYNFKAKLMGSEGSLVQNMIFAGTTNSGMKYYVVPAPYIDVRYLSESDDKLMNKLILDGHAVVLESDPMLSQDDSYCGCNCKCCFNLQAEGKSLSQCSMDCGCPCDCCQETQRKLTQYWVDKKHCLQVARELLAEHKKLDGPATDEYIKWNFEELWDHFDVNK